jgi:energy-coupling factor transporter ATP-binding protein EcfA2
MADRESRRRQRGAVAVSGKAAANGRVAKRDSDEIVAEIERTRQNLARTIDSLADRVSPASNVRRLRERAASELSRPEVQVAVLAAALAATGFAVYRIWARRRG